MNLGDLLTDVAAGFADVDAVNERDAGMTWSCLGRPFAVVSADGDSAEFALDPPVAAAAARTPGVAPSAHGPGWVLFRPAVLDGHAADRAAAWFASAHRRVIGG